MWFKFITESDKSTEDPRVESAAEIEQQQHLTCQRCQEPRDSFICVNCIQLGNFSNPDDKENYNDKKMCLYKIKKEIKECSDMYDQRRKGAIAYENLKFDVNEKQRHLEILQKLIAEKRENVQVLRQEKEKLILENVRKSENIADIVKEKCNIETQLISRQQQNEKFIEKFTNVAKSVEKSSRSKIKQLVRYIFPISFEGPKTPEQANTALSDEWVFYANGIDEAQYRIVGPTLPANGDYTVCFYQLKNNQCSTNDILPSQNAANRTMGALTYTTQLVQMMYHCLGVRMPQKITYSVFCKDPSKDTISKKIMKLNMSIMYLAYTQNVRLRAMNVDHTLENILIILDKKRSDLGRFGFHAVGNAPLVKSVDSLLLDIDALSDTTTDSENDADSDISFCSDLEKLSDVEEMLEATNHIQEEEVESSMSQSLVSSASSQLKTFFKWMK